MDWILRRLGIRQGGRAALVCYLRENGPIAYATPLFSREPRERAEAMLATGLTWFWKAAAQGAVAREWTELSRWSLAALLADLAPGNDLTSHIMAIAIDHQDSAEEVNDGRVADWMRAFNGAATGPLHAVVSHPGPGGDLVFVAQQPPDAIRGLLQGWGIDRDRAVRRAYPRLRGSALEDLIRSLQT